MTTDKTNPVTTSSGKTLDENKIIKKLSAVGIVGNILLSGFKLFAGIVGHSGAMVSDAVHSLSDVVATFIAFIGARIAKKPADESHPYGHDRLECIASLALGLILLLTGLAIGKSGLENILAKEHASLAVPSMIALAAAVVSIVVKEAMYWYTRYYAKRINSAVFMADAWHHRSDAFSSVGSLIGIAGAMLGYPVLDSVASVVICFFILKIACDILWDAAKKLLDTSCGAEYEKNLKDYVASQEDVVCVDLLNSRMFGNKVYVDLEIEVDGNRPLKETHAVAERIHSSVEQNFPEIKHIMIHVNPAEE